MSSWDLRPTSAPPSLSNAQDPQMGMMIKPDGNKRFDIFGPRGTGSVGIAMQPDGTASMGFGGIDHPGYKLVAEKDDLYFLLFHDKNINVRLKIGLEKDGSSILEILGENVMQIFFCTTKVNRWAAPCDGTSSST